MMAYQTQHWKGNSVVSLDEGAVVAKVADVMIDPQTLKVAALVISKGGLLGRETEYVPSTEVKVWGEDVILISRTGASVGESEIPSLDRALRVSDEIRGRDVINQDGTRIGRLADVLVDQNGALVGYALGDVYVEEFPFEEPNRIPVEATKSFGRDVLIVQTTKVAEGPE
jgi:sporulation protein YlmC with PRC-barrel domain